MLDKGKASTSLFGIAVDRASYPGEKILLTNIEISGKLVLREME